MPKALMVVLGLIGKRQELKKPVIRVLEILVSLCVENPLAIEQVIDESFHAVHETLEENFGIYWSMTWLLILKSSIHDKAFSVGVNLLQKLIEFIGRLEKFISPNHFEQKVQKVIIALIFKNLLLKSMKIRE